MIRSQANERIGKNYLNFGLNSKLIYLVSTSFRCRRYDKVDSYISYYNHNDYVERRVDILMMCDILFQSSDSVIAVLFPIDRSIDYFDR